MLILTRLVALMIFVFATIALFGSLALGDYLRAIVLLLIMGLTFYAYKECEDCVLERELLRVGVGPTAPQWGFRQVGKSTVARNFCA